MGDQHLLDQEMTRDPSVIVLGRGHRRRGRRTDGEEDAWGGVYGGLLRITKGPDAKHGDRLLGTPLS